MIIVYHQICKQSSSAHDENTVSLAAFERQMAELDEKEVVELKYYDPQNPDHVVITFDVGTVDILSVLPILKAKGYPFSVFLVGDYWETPGYVGAAECREIIDSGGNLQWHGKTHRNMVELTAEELEAELSIPTEIRSADATGFYALAYPYGQWNAEVALAAKKAGFKSSRGIENRVHGIPQAEGMLPVWDAVKMREETSVALSRPVSYIELAVPTWPCNFRCHYCYVGQHYSDIERGQVDDFQYSPAELAEALSVSRMGGRALVNFCANGETLILPRNVDYVEAMLEAGHYVMVVSNMTQTKAIERLLSLPIEQRVRLFFKCSFHWLELKRRNLLETFTINVNNARLKGASVSVEITPSDELEACIPEIMEYSRSHFGALPHITVPRENHELRLLTHHTAEEFARIWGVFESGLFAFKMSIWEKEVTGPCYAGIWGYSINIANGEMYRCSSCSRVGNLFPVTERLPQAPAPSTQCHFRHCYNGHFWEVFGMVPDISTPSYVEMRDRICEDGSHWVRSDMRKAFLTRATDIHTPYTPAELRSELRKIKRREYGGGVYARVKKTLINLIPVASWRRRLRRKYLRK